MLIGYARVSPDDQDTALQVAALRKGRMQNASTAKRSFPAVAGPDRNYTGSSIISGNAMCWIVWKLDGLSRSLRDVLTIMEKLADAGAGFKEFNQEAIDTTTAVGQAVIVRMIGAFAEFERAMLRRKNQSGFGCGSKGVDAAVVVPLS